MIEVSHLTKRYAAHTAVEDLSFTVPDGGVYGLLGPNGAGKTTTMNIMTGCLAATSGTVSIGGYDIFEDEREAKRRLGYLPELPPLPEAMGASRVLPPCSSCCTFALSSPMASTRIGISST